MAGPGKVGCVAERVHVLQKEGTRERVYFGCQEEVGGAALCDCGVRGHTGPRSRPRPTVVSIAASDPKLTSHLPSPRPSTQHLPPHLCCCKGSHSRGCHRRRSHCGGNNRRHWQGPLSFHSVHWSSDTSSTSEYCGAAGTWFASRRNAGFAVCSGTAALPVVDENMSST